MNEIFKFVWDIFNLCHRLAHPWYAAKVQVVKLGNKKRPNGLQPCYGLWARGRTGCSVSLATIRPRSVSVSAYTGGHRKETLSVAHLHPVSGGALKGGQVLAGTAKEKKRKEEATASLSLSLSLWIICGIECEQRQHFRDLFRGPADPEHVLAGRLFLTMWLRRPLLTHPKTRPPDKFH